MSSSLRLDKLLSNVVAHAVSFLSMYDHVLVVARVSKRLLAASKTQLSWTPALDFSVVSALPSAQWIDSWSCQPRRLTLRQPPWSDLLLPQFVALLRRVASLRLLPAAFPLRKDTRGIHAPYLTAQCLPNLRSLQCDFLSDFPAQRLRLPLLTHLSMVWEGGGGSGGDRDDDGSLTIDRNRLPSLRHLRLLVPGDVAQLDASVLPVLAALTIDLASLQDPGDDRSLRLLQQVRDPRRCPLRPAVSVVLGNCAVLDALALCGLPVESVDASGVTDRLRGFDAGQHPRALRDGLSRLLNATPLLGSLALKWHDCAFLQLSHRVRRLEIADEAVLDNSRRSGGGHHDCAFFLALRERGCDVSFEDGCSLIVPCAAPAPLAEWLAGMKASKDGGRHWNAVFGQAELRFSCGDHPPSQCPAAARGAGAEAKTSEPEAKTS